ncbi:MAG: TetR/AcrR family transcriptional regulator [Anaerolineae bacterium]
MPKTKKTKRSYNSTRRQAQAQETRRQIITAAGRLFSEHGYAGATIDAIAQEAGVAPETIFATFGNKRTILARLIDVAVGGDDQSIPLLDRPGPQAVLQESDPVHQLQLFAQDIVTILERVAPLFEIMRVAAKTEPDIADLLKNLLSERLHNMTAVVHKVATHSSLRTDLNEAQAAEIVWTLTSPEVFTLLTIDRGWSKAQYSHWLGDSLVRLLLP